jgi:D-glycero-alpha-D-manno-heptose-7-phosphate kinase
VIITRTPLRISLGGGGTDLPSYYRVNGGFLIAAAITKYIYVAIHENFEPFVLLKYSRIERADGASRVEHPLIREALQFTGIDGAVEISSMADIPAGTGLGSSGSFTVGLLNALYAYQHRFASHVDLAADACHLEIERLGEPVGKQDQYIAAVGGVTALTFHADERVTVESLDLSPETRRSLDEDLLLFYTGVRRSAAEELRALDEGTTLGNMDLSRNLDEVKTSGERTRRALQDGDLDTFARLLTEQWDLKHRRSPSPMHGQVDSWIRTGLDAGALGGKLVGAGGGGFLLFYAVDKAGLRQAMCDLGLQEVVFGIDEAGTSVIVR